MTNSDLCGSCKPYEISKISATKVFGEFYAQVSEKYMNIPSQRVRRGVVNNRKNVLSRRLFSFFFFYLVPGAARQELNRSFSVIIEIKPNLKLSLKLAHYITWQIYFNNKSNLKLKMIAIV